MRRITVALALIAVVSLVASVVVQSQSVPPPPMQKQPVARAAAIKQSSFQLPVTQVFLFTSGVGYFHRSSEVEGTATLDLSFPAADVNDLLKSMVLQDHGGGTINAIGFDSFDPVERTLKSFAVDLTKNPTFSQLLNQARGEKVEVDWQGQTVKGAIVGVEHQRQPAGKDNFVEVDLVNVLTSEGLRCLPLSQVQRVRFLNPHLESEFKRALDVLAFSHDTHKRMVSLTFAGAGKRPVSVGYVIENPIWKTSYRLVLNKEKEAFLQGWAIVDNATDEDWQNVQVNLVSGRPISFQMNLYQPLYVPRPWVELELFANLRPQTYGGAIDAIHKADEKARRREPRDSGLGFAKKAIAPAPPAMKAIDLKQGVAAEADAGEVGDFFQYAIKHPVNLARQKSAMLPIVNQGIDAQRFSIYNAGVLAKHPLLGLKLKNTTNLHLMQGPITVFEGASYAGDARILDLQPKEERLVSFAVDQGMEVDPVAKSAPEILITVKVVKGILQATYKLRQTKVYTAKNRASHDRQLLIEHPIRSDWTLLEPEKTAEKSRDMYRFQLAVPAGKTVSREVVEEQSRVTQVALTNADDQTVRLYVQSNITSPKVKEALEKALALKNKLAETQRTIAEKNKEIDDIAKDQARLRANMERVPPNSAPYQRYLKNFDEQEIQINALQVQIRTLRRQENEERKGYETFVLSLNFG